MQRVCCVCGNAVEKSDRGAVEIALSSLWHKRNPTTQGLQAHSTCFSDVLHEDIPFDDNIWRDES
jgi:hypothetical protein